MSYKEERKKDAENGHINELISRKSIVTKADKKPYVFISYSSKDWQRVLHEIVYELCMKKGLRVYFDTKFDEGSDSWLKQFQQNMSDKNCKAVLAFISPNYKTSYATLMELMSARESIDSAQTTVLPIYIGNADCNDYDNTGLGTRRFPDYSTNDLWDKELILFNKLFNNLMINNNNTISDKESAKIIYPHYNKDIICYDSELDKDLVFENEDYWKDKHISKDDIDEKNRNWKELTYDEKSENGHEYLNKKKNAELISMILSGIDKNSIDGVNKSITDAVYAKLNDLGYGDVFDKDLVESVEHSKYNVVILNDEEKTTLQVKAGGLIPKQNCGGKDGFIFKGWFVEGTEKEWDFDTDIVTQDISLVAKYEKTTPKDGRISLKGFIKVYNNNTFKKNTYKKFRLIGQGDAGRFSTDFQESAFDLVWECVMGFLSERGKAYIDEVNSKHPGVKNPAFIDLESYEKRDDKNKYIQITIDGLNNYYMYRNYSQYDWIGTVLKQRISDFGLKIDDFFFEYIPGDGPIFNDFFSVTDGGDPEPPKLVDIFEYELWGITHSANKMVDMLNAVFDLIAEKYPERIKNIAESDKITAVARKVDLDQGTANVSKIKQFSNYKGKEHPVNGEIYCVNAGYNRAGCIKQIERMLILCGENSNVFKITKEPEKSTRSVSKSGKEGLGEMLN